MDSGVDRANARDIIFDEQWYRSGGPAFEGDAYAHFSTVGWRQGRNPHPLFDVEHYLDQAPAVRDGDLDPLEHYLEVGVDLGIDPHALFDTSYYVERYWQSMGAENPLVHYLVEGYVDECDPTPFFSTAYYLDKNPDVAASDMNPLAHYAVFGGREHHRRPHPQFYSAEYARRRKIPLGANPLLDFLTRARALQSRVEAPVERPEVSIVVLNLDKSVLTIECVLEIFNIADRTTFEVIVVDNGSGMAEFAKLTAWLPAAVRIVRVGSNRGFGEGNNIGVDAARGRFLLFLNNDAFVADGTLETLTRELKARSDAGAVGPKFVYPDGRVQEAGGFISSCGTVTQRGKYLDDLPGRFAKTEIVDYVSAACVLVPRALFEEVGGFDLAWDPAYYEDVDLCFKLELLGKRTYYCPEAVVTHIESATSTDASNGLRLNTVVQINREKFIARWGEYIERKHDPAAINLPPPAPLRPASDPSAGTAVLYTPYALIPGGGERYLLGVAQWLSRRYRTYVVTADQYSSFRLRQLGAELELDLSEIRLQQRSALADFAGCDVFVAMGNEALPPVAPIGRKNAYICQFPFPMHPSHVTSSWGWLDRYDDVVVYSEYSARYFRERTQHLVSRPPRVNVIAPAVPMYADASYGSRAAGRIVNVGRFHPSGHCKRQDTLVDAFRRLVETSGRTDLELHLAGTVSAEAVSREFYVRIHERARDLPVFFHLNASPDTVRDLYASSSYYWHATGYGQSELLFPERLEHFGITIVEAMSAGAIPFVFAAGGPSEIVRDGATGYYWRTIDDLVEAQRRALALSTVESEEMRQRGRTAALRYDTANFEDALLNLFNRTLEDGTYRNGYIEETRFALG